MAWNGFGNKGCGMDLGFELEERRMWIWPCPQRNFTYKPINNDEQVLQTPFSIEFAWVKLSGFGH
jgi:hypothetical protein